MDICTLCLGTIDFVFSWSSLSAACVVVKHFIVNKLPFICLCLYSDVVINKFIFFRLKFGCFYRYCIVGYVKEAKFDF